MIKYLIFYKQLIQIKNSLLKCKLNIDNPRVVLYTVYRKSYSYQILLCKFVCTYSFIKTI